MSTYVILLSFSKEMPPTSTDMIESIVTAFTALSPCTTCTVRLRWSSFATLGRKRRKKKKQKMYEFYGTCYELFWNFWSFWWSECVKVARQCRSMPDVSKWQTSSLFRHRQEQAKGVAKAQLWNDSRWNWKREKHEKNTSKNTSDVFSFFGLLMFFSLLCQI